MPLLVDSQLAERQKLDPPLVSGVPSDRYDQSTSSIQASSIDLSIGGIFIPKSEEGKPGSVNAPLGEVTLQQGHSAVIRTKEILTLGAEFAGIAFPPAGVSLKGLLMTNPGHIDPGYSGPLHLTVINMSAAPYVLRRGDRIMRVLLVHLEKGAEFPYDKRHNVSDLPSPISPELLNRLSSDFLDVERRARKVAKKAVRNAHLLSLGIPIIVTLLTILGSYTATNSSWNDKAQKVYERLSIVENFINKNQDDGEKMKSRLERISQEIVELRSDLKRAELEDKILKIEEVIRKLEKSEQSRELRFK